MAGTISVGLRSLPKDSVFASLGGSDTAVAFRTKRYTENTPLVVRGPGTGGLVIPSGLFNDLLRLSKSLAS